MQQMIRCPGCGSPNSFGVPYCVACGTPLPTPCPNCGASLEAGARFCGNCGAQLGGVPPGRQQQGAWGQQQQQNFPQQGNYNAQQGGYGQQQAWGQPPPTPPPQQGWGQTPQQQWGQAAPPPPPPPPPPPQQGSWGAQPTGMDYPGAWGAPRQKSSTGLVILLVGLLIALGGFAYWAFLGSPPWGSTGTVGGGTAKISEGPFISALSDNTSATRTVTIMFKSSESSKGRVAYGADIKYGAFSTWEATAVTDHNIVLKDLTPDSSYHYQVYLRDKNNKDSYSIDYSFRTPK
jgi:hypothetical protein